MTREILDLEELVVAWAKEFPLHSHQRNDVGDILPTDINWKHFMIKHGPTQYTNRYIHELEQSPPKSNVLTTSYFVNDTDEPKDYNLNSERKTTSISKITLNKSFTVGVSMNLKLRPPNPVVEANAGFKGETSITNANEETMVEEMKWTVNSTIKVPPNTTIKAELTLKEQEYSSDFKCETSFNGVVKVTLRDKRNSSPITTLKGRAKDIFRKEHGFRVEKSVVYFVTEGSCKSRFGIEQHVNLTEATNQTDQTEDETNEQRDIGINFC